MTAHTHAPNTSQGPRAKSAALSHEGGVWGHSLAAKSAVKPTEEAEQGARGALVLNENTGVTTCETATEQGEKSQHRSRHQQHNHLLQVKKCPGGGTALGFGVSGLPVVLFIFWLLKTHQLILYVTPDSFQLCWPSRAFPFSGRGLNTSPPHASSSLRLCFNSYFYHYSFITILPFGWYRRTISPQAQRGSTAFPGGEGSTEPL